MSEQRIKSSKIIAGDTNKSLLMSFVIALTSLVSFLSGTGDMASYIAGTYTCRTPYHLRRLNYINPHRWDEETHYLNVKVNGVEVEFDFWSGGSIVHLIKQPQIGDSVELIVEEITVL